MSPLFIQLTQCVLYLSSLKVMPLGKSIKSLFSYRSSHEWHYSLGCKTHQNSGGYCTLYACLYTVPIRLLLSSSVSFFLDFFCCWSSAPCIKCKLFSSPIAIFTFKFKIDDLVIWMLVIWILNASYIRHDLMLNSYAEWKNMPHLDQLLSKEPSNLLEAIS